MAYELGSFPDAPIGISWAGENAVVTLESLGVQVYNVRDPVVAAVCVLALCALTSACGTGV
jgi:hypothetical protein